MQRAMKISSKSIFVTSLWVLAVDGLVLTTTIWPWDALTVKFLHALIKTGTAITRGAGTGEDEAIHAVEEQGHRHDDPKDEADTVKRGNHG